MPNAFPDEVVAAVLTHMNDDHLDDSLIIVQGHAEPAATSATMTGLDSDAGMWSAVVDGTDVTLRIPWTETAVERPDIRREVVRLYDAALEKLGRPPREAEH